MNGALKLAAIGWVADDPVGNRLRWIWPENAVDGDMHVLPKTILVERAPLDDRYDPRAAKVYGPAAGVPLSLWKQLGDLTLSGLMPVSRSFSPPVQAVRFLYKGWPAVLYAFDGARCVVTQPVTDGHWVVLQAAAIDLIVLTTPVCELQMLSTLDLYEPPPLPFKLIAEIDLTATASADFADAATRYSAAPTLDSTKWTELQNLWNVGWAEPPGAPGSEGAPSAWRELQIVLGSRWEHAVFCGVGFVDGPNTATPALDTWHDLLNAPAASAYRVRDADGRLDPSNVVCVPGALAPDLSMLPPPVIGDGAVRIGSSGAIRASWSLSWQSPDPGIVGVQVRETLNVGGNLASETYDARGHRASDPPGAGIVQREEIVDSHQVSVAAAVRAQDGFDRLGPWGPSSPLVALRIDHHPQPPPFRSATNDGVTAILNQYPPANWAPDALVTAAGGTLRIHRRVANPARVDAPVLQVIPAGDYLAVKLGGSGPADPAAFVGGAITIDALKGTVTALAWPVALVALPAGNTAVVAVSPGAVAHLSQSPTDPALFVQVDERPVTGLPAAISFADPLPPSGLAQLAEYRAQVAFAGLTGPLGAPVQALLLPPTPNVPPPFTVTVLGIDFYHRTLVQLDLTHPTSDQLEVSWANGDVPNADFGQHAVPGDAGVRYAENGITLFDTLSLPIPKKIDRTVTIGVQAVNAADGRSTFKTVVHTLPAL